MDLQDYADEIKRNRKKPTKLVQCYYCKEYIAIKHMVEHFHTCQARKKSKSTNQGEKECNMSVSK